MEVLIQSIAGFVLVPLYNWIKGKLGLADTAAAWVLMFITLGLAFPIALASGELAGTALDLSNPPAFLAAIAKAFLVLLGSAEGLFMLVKQRK